MLYSIDITITNPDGQVATLSQAFSFTPLPPAIAAIDPAVGPQAGGTPVTITGQGLSAGATVRFGGIQATDVQVAADGLSLTCVTPPYSTP